MQRIHVESLCTPMRLHISNLVALRNTINTKISILKFRTEAVLALLMVKELFIRRNKQVYMKLVFWPEGVTCRGISFLFDREVTF